jgi:hypothetical protein
MANIRTWPSASTKKTTMRSIYNATTAERATISYNITRSKHRFTKTNHDAVAPTEKVSIRVSHVFLPTCWCPKCDRWTSHHENLHDDRTLWQAAKEAQLAKQEENRKKFTMVLHTNNTETLSTVKITKDPLTHMITTTTTLNDLGTIVAAHHHRIARTPKCAVRAALVTTTDKAHFSVSTRKDTNHKRKHLGITKEISTN